MSLFTVPEVAHLLRLSPGAVRNLINQKEIPAIRLGKQYRIPKHVIENLLSPLLGDSPEAMGFGIWKGEKESQDPVAYVRRIRKKEDAKTLEQIMKEIKEWEQASSSTPIS